MRNIIREIGFRLLQNYVSVVLCLLFVVAVYWNFRKREEINTLCELIGSDFVSVGYSANESRRAQQDLHCEEIRLKAYAFSIYRHDAHAGDGGCIADERYRTIAEVLGHPYKADEEY